MPRIIGSMLMAATLAGMVSACSPPVAPAAQEPIELTPGLYQITLSGAGLAQFTQQRGGKTEDEVCVRAGDVSRFPDRLARNYFSLHPGCTFSPQARQGNAIGGTLSCPLDPQRAMGKITLDYEGVISADRVETTGRMKIEARSVPGALSEEEASQLAQGAALMEQVGIKVVAIRSGDCS